MSLIRSHSGLNQIAYKCPKLNQAAPWNVASWLRWSLTQTGQHLAPWTVCPVFNKSTIRCFLHPIHLTHLACSVSEQWQLLLHGSSRCKSNKNYEVMMSEICDFIALNQLLVKLIQQRHNLLSWWEFEYITNMESTCEQLLIWLMIID